MNFGSETEILEFKKTTGELHEAVVSIASMLNKHSKGEVYFGIKNDGTVIGQDIGEQTLRDVSKAISDNIEPQIYPSIEAVSIDSKSCIRVVAEGSDAPYFAYGRVRMRVADEDKKLTPTEVENYFRRKLSQVSNWDSSPSDYSIDDVDEDKLKAYMKRSNESGRINFEYSTKKEVLSKLNLLSDEKPNNAAIAMFGNNPRFEIQMAIFATEERLTFTDIKREKGTVLELVDIAEKYIVNTIRWRAVIDDSSLQRKEIPEIPIVAMREALYNSYAHKDWRVPQNNEVSIHSNRIEIYNPGTFPPGLSPDDFLDGSGRSVHRNALLAQIMYYSKDIESFGTGLKRIADECRESNVKYEFVLGKLGFTVVFYRPAIHVDDKVGDKTVDKTKREERYALVLDYLKTHEFITTSIIAGLLNVSGTTAKRIVGEMSTKSLLIPQGDNKARKYYLK